MINFEEKRVLVHTDQVESTKGKKVLVFDQLKLRMMNPKNPEAGVWKENVHKKVWREWRPTSSFLMEKYARQRQRSMFGRLGGYKQKRLPVQERNERMASRTSQRDAHGISRRWDGPAEYKSRYQAWEPARCLGQATEHGYARG
jgi:hypothetical protein